MGFVCLKLLRYQTSSQNSSVCGWVHWVLLTFLFLCSFCCPHFMGFCLSFPVLTHGSWGTVRHLLAFAPTNHPQTNKHLKGSALQRTSQAVGLPFQPVTRFCLRAPGPLLFLQEHSTQGSALSCLCGERTDSAPQQLCGPRPCQRAPWWLGRGSLLLLFSLVSVAWPPAQWGQWEWKLNPPRHWVVWASGAERWSRWHWLYKIPSLGQERCLPSLRRMDRSRYLVTLFLMNLV